MLNPLLFGGLMIQMMTVLRKVSTVIICQQNSFLRYTVMLDRFIEFIFIYNTSYSNYSFEILGI